MFTNQDWKWVLFSALVYLGAIGYLVFLAVDHTSSKDPKTGSQGPVPVLVLDS